MAVIALMAPVLHLQLPPRTNQLCQRLACGVGHGFGGVMLVIDLGGVDAHKAQQLPVCQAHGVTIDHLADFNLGIRVFQSAIIDHLCLRRARR